MKYYAVTDDPNELLHYGRLGMKWGQHIFVGTKSLAYKNAMGKLRKSAGRSAKASTKSSGSHKTSRLKSAIQKSRTQRAINKQKKQEAKFNKAVEKAQNRIKLTENMSNLDHLKAYEKRIDHDYKIDAFNAKTAAKRERVAEKMNRKYAKNEAKMDKYTQLAREGRLKYGKLSPEQVDRITNRLAIERTARQLGNTEKPKFRTRMKDAVQEGILQGVVQGTAAGMREVAIDKVQNRLRNKRVLDKANRNEAQRQKEATRIKNKKTRKEIREDLNQEAYEAQVEAGENVFQRSRVLHPFMNSGKKIQKAEVYKRLHQEKIEQNHIAGEKLNKLEDLSRERKRLQDAETKRRNSIDERWQQYVNDGGSEYILESNDRFAKDLSSNSKLAKNNPDKLYSEREKLLAKSGYSSEAINERKNEAKRISESETKRRNEIDEAYRRYVEKGNPEHGFWDVDSVGNRVAIDLRSNGSLKNNPTELYRLREKYINRSTNNEKLAEENKEKNAYNSWKLQESNARERAARAKALEDCEKRYNRKVETWKNNGQKGAKPRYVDYVNAGEIAKAYRKPDEIPDYEQAKIFSTLGLPSPLQNNKNNNNQNNKNKKK